MRYYGVHALGDGTCVSQAGVDGLIVSNTTLSRPDTLKSRHSKESGGLSGEPLKQLATDTVRDMYRLTQGNVHALSESMHQAALYRVNKFV